MSDSTPNSNDLKSPDKKLSIFLSYGHDEFADIARRLKKDIESRGHKVWFDEEKLKAGKLWEDYIQDGIEEVAASNDSGRVVLLMTPHSVRRPDGFCLNELARAIDREITIIPVMLVQVEPPFCICRIQWFDARDCVPLEDSNELYEKKLNQLLEAIEDKKLDFDGVTNAVSVLLKPFDFCKDIKHYNPQFTGRELLFNEVSNWLHDENAGRVFFITGELGVGLSTIAMMLYSKNPEIKAVHFCRYEDKDKCDTNRVVRSITHQLTTQLPGLLEAINGMSELRKIVENPSVTTVFERLLVDPLSSGTQPGNEPIVILIDSMHEASHIDAKTKHRINEIAELLSKELERLPKRIRFILTSLPVREVRVPLQKYKPFHISARSKMNMEDIHTYLRKELKDRYGDDLYKLEEDVHAIAEKSEYLFLYLEKIKEEIDGGFLSLENIEEFPNGLGEFFLNFFDRQFKKDKPGRYYEQKQRPILEVIAAAFEPISLDILSKIFKWGPYDNYKYQEDWGSIFPVIDNRVRPFHHSLIAWITDINKAGYEYIVEVSEGHKKLAKAGWREFQRDSENMPDYYKTYLLAHLNFTGQKDKVQEYVTDCGVICNYYNMVRLYELSRFWKEIENDKLIRICLASWNKELSNEKSFMSLAARCLGRLFQNKGDYETALFYFNKKLEFAEEKQSEVEHAEALYDIAWCYRHIDKFEDSIKNAEDARIIFDRLDFKSDVAKCLSVKGVSHWHLNEDMIALNEIKQAHEIFKDTNDVCNLAKALNHLGIIHRSLGQFTEAIRYLDEAKKIFDRINDKKGLGKCLNSIGTCLWWSGDLDNAISNYNEANQINTEIDNQYVLGLTANSLGYIYLEKKEWLNAKTEFSKASVVRQKLKIESYYLIDLSGLAMVNYKMGDLSGAKELSSKVFRDLKKYKMVEDMIRAYYNHYLIMKDGNLKEKTSAINALKKAKSLINKRIAKISDTEIRNRFRQNVPQISEILSINEPGL